MGYIYGFVTEVSESIEWEGTRNGFGVGRIKVGQTDRDVDTRIREQQTANPHGLDAWKKVLIDTNLRDDGSIFSDRDVIRALRNEGVHVIGRSEWVEATPAEIKRCIDSLKERTPFSLSGVRDNFKLRPEQKDVIDRTIQRFNEQAEAGVRRSVLWNAKMRFGKSFAALQLAQSIGAEHVLVLTWIPSVVSEWKNCLSGHIAFSNWQWFDDLDDIDKASSPYVRFVSGQALFHIGDLGQKRRAILSKFEWDLLIIDEQHWGADKAKGRDQVADLNLQTDHCLELSGTPFSDLESGYFNPLDTLSWSYTDEQQAKREWNIKNEVDPINQELKDDQENPGNPWHGMPRMEWRVFNLAETLESEIEIDEAWNLGEMFSVNEGQFVYEDLVRQWLKTISRPTTHKMERYYPYERRKGGGPSEQAAQHGVWVLEGVEQCRELATLISETEGFSDVTVVNASGSSDDISTGQEALRQVKDAIKTSNRTITLTCGMLLTGVTVPEWGVIVMLQPGSSMSSYFQAAFRVQSRYVTGAHVNKPIAYVYDFEPNRALQVISNYADAVMAVQPQEQRQNAVETLCRFIRFIWHDEGEATRLSAEDLIMYSSQKIGRLYLAKRWGSGRFVNPDAILEANQRELNEILNRIRQHKKSFTIPSELIISSNPELEGDTGHTGTSKRSEQNRERSKRAKIRKQIQEKLTRLLANIPMFMYLTEERESALIDVIESVDTQLFEEVTGITLADFNVLRDAGAYDDYALNHAVLQFREEEAKSLGYLGVDPPTVSQAGWSTSNEGNQG